MEAIGALLSAILEGMKMEFTIYGHTFSWWQVFVFTIVVSIIGIIIGGFIRE